MAHRFDRTDKDPYVEAAQQVENNISSGQKGLASGADEDIYTTLGNAIVTALGDVAAQAFRHGVNDPKQLEGLAEAVAKASKTAFLTYQGEVDPEPALRAIESDPRSESLVPEARDKLRREIEKTRALEARVLDARRLQDLLDYAGSLGLHMQQDPLEKAQLLVPGRNIPGPGTRDAT